MFVSAIEKRELLRILLPAALTDVCRRLMFVTDMAFLGHLIYDRMHPDATSTSFLASASIAIAWMGGTNVILFAGLGSALRVLVSQAFGNRNFTLMDTWLTISLLVATILSIPIGISWWYSGYIMAALIGHEGCNSQCESLTTEFVRISVWYLWPSTMVNQLTAYWMSQRVVYPQVVYSAAATVFNVFSNYLFIYSLGFGFQGSALATLTTQWLLCIVFFGHTFYKKAYKDDEQEQGDKTPFRWLSSALAGWSPTRFKQYLVQAIPLAVGFLIEDLQIQIVSVFAGWVGPAAIATHNSMLGVFAILLSIHGGLMRATTVRVGNNLGAGAAATARGVYYFSLFVALMLGVVVAAVLLIGHSWVGHIFSSDPTLWALASKLSYLLGASYLILCVGLVSIAGLEGQGRSTACIVVFVVGSWIVGVPTAYFMGLVAGFGLLGLWIGISTGYTFITVISFYFMVTTKWKVVAKHAVDRASKEGGDAAITEETPLLEQPKPKTEP
eukprot:TRINITY_DN21128_c0_g1_i1.p1 TRINITY_DN21128_c0_g1~~TRINITY_DN21128_c0_g1_i1.p1  ORF type:complete len:499 (+),score=41.06 TRINITY_DN21128_c0_g1_i1:80-1576(+)